MAFNPNDHMMSLKGRDYLQVMWRLVWFREEHPDWCIDTSLVEHNKNDSSAVFVAKICDETGRLLSTGYGSECSKDFRDYLEKAETKAVGRALAMLGYGTQFAPELDEGERIADSPVARHDPIKCDQCGKEIVPYPGKTGKMVGAWAHAKRSLELYKCILCIDCINEMKEMDKRSDKHNGNEEEKTQ